MTLSETNASPSDLPGAPPLVSDHEMLRRVGVGAYGEVWLARNVAGTWRAVKVVRRVRFEHERNYEREFSGLKKFEPLSRAHEGLMDILQIGRDDIAGYFYYVMELADDANGGVLDQLQPGNYQPSTLAVHVGKRGRLPIDECASIGADVAEALGFLHRQGLVHRDVKPSNIIFVGGRPKLADVGLVAGLGDSRSFVGTDGYIPPEGPGAPTADLYSLGKVLYELATGKNRMDFPDVPGDLREPGAAPMFGELNGIILRACAPELAQRHATAEELRAELLLVSAGRSVIRLRRDQKRMAQWRRLALVTAALSLLGVSGFVLQQKQTERANRRTSEEAARRLLSQNQELAARQHLYAADVHLAQQAMDSGNFGRAESLLANHDPESAGRDLRGFEWFHFWHRVNGDSVGVLRGHEQVVSSIVLSVDGKKLLSAGFDSTIREWSLDAKKELRRWTLPGCFIMAMARNPEGTHLAVEGGNRPMSALLNLSNGNWLTNASSASPSIIFSPGGDKLVRGARMTLFETEGVVEITDLSLRVERVLEEAGGRAWFSPDGRFLVTGSWKNDLKIWTWPELSPVGRLADAGLVLGLAFSPDGRHIVSSSRDGRLILWDQATHKKVRELHTHDNTIIWSVSYSPDGTRIASSGNDQTVRVWEAGTLAPQSVFRGHGSEVWAVIWSQDGRHLISGGKDTTIRIWNVNPEKVELEFTNVVQNAVFSPDERLIAIRQRHAGVSVWELSTGRRLATVDGVAELGGFSSSESTLTLLKPDWTFQRLSPDGNQVIETRRLQPIEGAFTRRRLSPDGRWLATGFSDGTIFVHDIKTSDSPRRLNGHQQMILSFQFSPDGRQMLSGSMDRTARLWNLETGRGTHVFTGHGMGVGSVSFSPDATKIATGSWDDTAHLWDSATGKELAVFGGHASSVHDVALAPDNRSMAVLGGDGLLKFWSLAAGREAGLIPLDRGTGMGWVSFSPGGQWLAAVSQTGKLRLFAAPRKLPPKNR